MCCVTTYESYTLSELSVWTLESHSREDGEKQEGGRNVRTLFFYFFINSLINFISRTL